jgi:23S rRNA (cytidine1920-2'-O)/16S rRNA (cytidine1409-2'-O)-methyltransferase
MKVRLDRLLMDRGLAETRSKALGLVLSGSVMVNGKVITKAGTEVLDGAEILLKEDIPYVSRAGLKLKAALDAFHVDIQGKVAIDIGASTGGFTDAMLQKGAKRVYAVDVGHGQLHYKLRKDSRVVNIEGINARTLDPGFIPEPCDIATFDVSFISLKLVVPPVLKVLKRQGEIIALVKPQFEAGRAQVKKGIVRDETIIAGVLNAIETLFLSMDLSVTGCIPSPIKGAKGNQEYLMHAFLRGET